MCCFGSILVHCQKAVDLQTRVSLLFGSTIHASCCVPLKREQVISTSTCIHNAFGQRSLEVVSANAVKVDQARRRKPLGCRGEKTCLVHTKRKCLTKSGFKVQYECHWTQRLKRNIYRHVRSIQVAFATYSIVGFRHRRPRRTAPSLPQGGGQVQHGGDLEASSGSFLRFPCAHGHTGFWKLIFLDRFRFAGLRLGFEARL